MSMDFHLKQWRNQQQHESEEAPSGKMPRLLLDQQPSGSALPLFVPEPNSKISNLSAFPDSTTTANRFSKTGGSYFSLAQWQELELQALIFRHMLAGAAVPPELLQLIKKSLLNSPPYYLHHPFQHYQPALLQSGYWGRAAMDPEPGRCRRTDGKKWRCSRDVVAGQKYCERHMHRGRNRSRKPVEIPTPTASGGGGGGGAAPPAVASVGSLKSTTSPPPLTNLAGGESLFALSGPSPSIDLLHLDRSPPGPKTEHNTLFEHQTENVSGDGRPDGRVLRRFFDDWPRSIHDTDDSGTGSNHNNSHNGSRATSSAYLSMSILGRQSSDVSLKLSTGGGGGDGDGDDLERRESGERERERPQLNWAAGWGTHQSAQMGGPLAEALRSATSNSSPTSVLHQLPRGTTASDASYVR